MAVYLEISPLFDEHWTGIATVAAGVARYALLDQGLEWKFMRDTIIIAQDDVRAMLDSRSGSIARMKFERSIGEQHHLTYEEAARSKAVFIHMKPVRNYFKEEALMVHDLSPLLTPQFHSSETISHFGNRIRQDIESSQYFFAVSEATRGDIETYFGVDRSRSAVIPMGVDIDVLHLSGAQDIARNALVEPYVVVLGTLEPRKNGRLILEFIARNPAFAERYRVVFVGRDGWLDERDHLLEEIQRSGIPRDRVVFTGFVTERAKIALLYNSSFCIYSSFFEGYGLPILEAALLQKIVVCSRSSSMPEVAPERCLFFDPNSVSEFARAITCAEMLIKQNPASPASILSEMTREIAEHGWDRCYNAIRAWAVR